MRVNVYVEELTVDAQVVETTYKSSRTGAQLINYGVRVYLKSHPDLHFKPHDDDRSAVTFWLGDHPDIADWLRDAIWSALENREKAERAKASSAVQTEKQ